jgi:hypothetical protein
MEFRAANEQQQEALWRVFLMFVAMALLIIRTGLVSRGLAAALPLKQAKTPRRRSTINHPRRRPKSFTRPRLCCCAWPSRRAAVRSEHARGLGTDEPAAAPAYAEQLSSASLCERPGQRLDSS